MHGIYQVHPSFFQHDLHILETILDIRGISVVYTQIVMNVLGIYLLYLKIKYIYIVYTYK